MTLGKSRVNNMYLQNQRKDISYEAVIIDLVLIGALDKKTYEGLTGKEFPSSVRLPATYAEFNAPETGAPVEE
jgi:hypothetical protein